MTQFKELLVNYEEFEEPQMVSLGDGRSVKALGKGNIQFTMLFKVSSPKRVTMFDVLYVRKDQQNFDGVGTCHDDSSRTTKALLG